MGHMECCIRFLWHRGPATNRIGFDDTPIRLQIDLDTLLAFFNAKRAEPKEGLVQLALEDGII